MNVMPLSQLDYAARQIADFLRRADPLRGQALVGIPRGGLVAAYMIAKHSSLPVYVAGDPVLGTPVLVDDIIVTGKTLAETAARYPQADTVVALVVKGGLPAIISGFKHWFTPIAVASEAWVQFPWEVNDQDGGTPEAAVQRLIEWVGDDPDRPDLIDTPRRVLKFLSELREAGQDNSWQATAFESQVDDLIAVSGVPFFSLCEHHMLPYFGLAHVGYIPKGKILGLSKVARTVGRAAAGLTVQEHLVHKIATELIEHTGSPDVGVVLRATHTCMVLRGAKAQGAQMTTSAMLGAFRSEPALRSEFLNLVKGG